MYIHGNETFIFRSIMASIKNHEWCCKEEEKKRNGIYKFKYVTWYVLLLFLSPRKKVCSKKFVCALTPVNEKRIKDYADENEYYKFARLNSSLHEIKNNRSVFSPYTLLQRIKITIKGCLFFIRSRKELKGYIHFALEYYAIANFVMEEKPEEIITPGMYDRYSTFISYLGYSLGIKLIGIQDGAAVDIQIPMKIYCDKMYCFDKFEENIIKTFFINSNCEFIFTGFKSTLCWKKYSKKSKKLVAIASQDWFTNKTLQLIEVIMSFGPIEQCDFLVFPHYRESVKSYEKICKKYPRLIVCPKERFCNVDLLITFYSTIVYDFWSVNSELKVLCLHIPGYEPGYYSRPNVIVVEEFEDIIHTLKKYKIF